MDTARLGGSAPPVQPTSGRDALATVQPAHLPKENQTQGRGFDQGAVVGVSGEKVVGNVQENTRVKRHEPQSVPQSTEAEEVPLEKKNRRIYLLGLGVFVVLVFATLILLYWRLFRLS